MDDFGKVLEYINGLNIGQDNIYDIKYLYERAYYTYMCNTILNVESSDDITFIEKGVFPNDYIFSFFNIRIEYLGEDLIDSLIYFPKKMFKVDNIKASYKKYLLDKKDKKRMKKVIKKSNIN